MLILDTNVISEMMHSEPCEEVTSWLDRQPGQSIWITSVSVFGVRFGLESMPVGRRRTHLMNSFELWIKDVIQGRIAP